ncbi:hypothetical protein HN630_02070 [archaeon]|jgi:hypothetical protein|nr:hypothetical protein [archaeon]MBT6956207.1 hypothetical protein [archaeon]MBT7567665.1 hypothetical protein [archaeon]
MRNKKGQFFALYLVLLTLFMCGIVMTIYNIQSKNVDSYLVSPEKMLLLERDAEVFEMAEKSLIRSAAVKVGWSGGEQIRDSYLELLETDSGGEKIRAFIFEDLVHGGKNKVILADALKEPKSQINFLKTEGIYNFNLNGDTLEVSRKQLGKTFRLTAINPSKINFVVDVNYVYSGDYEIKKGVTN